MSTACLAMMIEQAMPCICQRVELTSELIPRQIRQGNHQIAELGYRRQCCNVSQPHPGIHSYNVLVACTECASKECKDTSRARFEGRGNADLASFHNSELLAFRSSPSVLHNTRGTSCTDGSRITVNDELHRCPRLFPAQQQPEPPPSRLSYRIPFGFQIPYCTDILR